MIDSLKINHCGFPEDIQSVDLLAISVCCVQQSSPDKAFSFVRGIDIDAMLLFFLFFLDDCVVALDPFIISAVIILVQRLKVSIKRHWGRL